MAQDSKRQRYLRRVKRERSQLRQAIGVQRIQLLTVTKMLLETQDLLRKLKQPSFTVTTLADDVDPDVSDVPQTIDTSNNPTLEDTMHAVATRYGGGTQEIA